jgi:hypothetical protein
MNFAKDIFDIFDLFFGFGSIASAGFFYFLYKVVKERHEKFSNAISLEGVVIDFNAHAYPVVEYERGGKIIQFTSAINAPGAKVGQRIDLELSPNGVARIKSNGHAAIQKGLLLASIAFFVAGCFFLIKRFT